MDWFTYSHTDTPPQVCPYCGYQGPGDICDRCGFDVAESLAEEEYWAERDASEHADCTPEDE